MFCLRVRRVSSNFTEIFSPVKGEIWVGNYDIHDYSSPVGTKCGFSISVDTQIAFLQDLENIQDSCLLLSNWLNVNSVKNELIIEEGTPHFGVMFDVEEIRSKVVAFLQEYL